MRLLFVCTGNRCRSAIAERLATAWARQSLADRAGDVRVASAGLEAVAGRPMEPLSAEALIRVGGDPRGFRTTAFEPAPAASADLILTMSRHQRTAVLEHVPRGLRHTFTLREAADLIGRADLRGLEELPTDARARAFGLRLHAARPLRSASPDDDIADPIGRRRAVHDDVARQIATALRPVAAVLFCPAAGDQQDRAAGRGSCPVAG